MKKVEEMTDEELKRNYLEQQEKIRRAKQIKAKITIIALVIIAILLIIIILVSCNIATKNLIQATKL